jgi:transposase
MMRTRDYTLNSNEVAELEQLIGEAARQQVVKRATAVRMLHLGQTSVAVGKLLLVSSASGRNWFERFGREGKVGLEDRQRAGRPRQATETYWQVIEAALQSDPQALGYPVTIWTLERLRDHAQPVTGKRLNAAYLSEQMKARG